MDIQRLRNLTTGRLHTEMGHIYEDLGWLTGESGLMTHMLPRAMDAVRPWLEEKVTDIKQEDLDVLHQINKKLVGKCFQKGEAYIKIVDCSLEDGLFCNGIDFDYSNLDIDDDIGFDSFKEIENEGYDELSLEVFDKHIKTKTQEFMKTHLAP